MSSAICFNLDQSKILSPGNGLNLPYKNSISLELVRVNRGELLTHLYKKVAENYWVIYFMYREAEEKNLLVTMHEEVF